jgi:hypothetical protein
MSERKSRRVPGVPQHIEEYSLCILFHLLLPLLPLGVELVVLGHVEHKSLLLFLAIYPLSIGVSSRSRLMFGATIVLGIVYSIFFGMIAGGVAMAPVTYLISYLCLSAVVLIHACERYNRHVAERELFWDFG